MRPFALKAADDPYIYSEENMHVLRQAIAQIEGGKDKDMSSRRFLSDKNLGRCGLEGLLQFFPLVLNLNNRLKNLTYKILSYIILL